MSLTVVLSLPGRYVLLCMRWKEWKVRKWRNDTRAGGHASIWAGPSIKLREEKDHWAGWAWLTVLPQLWGRGWPERRTSCNTHVQPLDQGPNDRGARSQSRMSWADSAPTSMGLRPGWPKLRTSCRKHARPHLDRSLENNRTMHHSPGQSVHIPSTTFEGKYGADWTYTRRLSFFSVDTVAATKAPVKMTKNVTGCHTNQHATKPAVVQPPKKLLYKLSY